MDRSQAPRARRQALRQSREPRQGLRLLPAPVAVSGSALSSLRLLALAVAGFLDRELANLFLMPAAEEAPQLDQPSLEARTAAL